MDVKINRRKFFFSAGALAAGVSFLKFPFRLFRQSKNQSADESGKVLFKPSILSVKRETDKRDKI